MSYLSYRLVSITFNFNSILTRIRLTDDKNTFNRRQPNDQYHADRPPNISTRRKYDYGSQYDCYIIKYDDIRTRKHRGIDHKYDVSK